MPVSEAERREAREAAAQAAENRLKEAQNLRLAGVIPGHGSEADDPDPELIAMLPHPPFDLLGGILRKVFARPRPFLNHRTALTPILINEWAELMAGGPAAFAGQAGVEELQECFNRLRTIALQVVLRRSAAEWLMLLRRLPVPLLDGVRMAPRWYLEQLVSRSRERGFSVPIWLVAYRLQPKVLEDVHDILMIGTAMWNLGRAYRTVAKGAIITNPTCPTFEGVGISPDPSIADAILLYDARHAEGAGTESHRQGIFNDYWASRDDLLRPDGVIPIWEDHWGELGSWAGNRTSIFPLFYATDAVFNPVAACGTPSSMSLGAAGVLRTCWQEIIGPHPPEKLPGGAWSYLGLVDLKDAMLRRGLTDFAAVAHRYDPCWDPMTAYAELTAAPVLDPWANATSPVLHPSKKGHFVVDLLAASGLLHQAFVRPSGGSDANAWTALFQRQVQEAIDRTAWKPPGELRSLIGEVIHEGGHAVTDLDAIAYREGTLLLCDAKAWITGDRHKYGDYDAVRNRLADVEAADWQWRQRVSAIAARPGLLPIRDVSVRSILGVVVCPDVPYVLPGACTAEVLPDLRAVATITELHRALAAT